MSQHLNIVPEAQSDHREALPPLNKNTPPIQQTDYETKVTMYDMYTYPKNNKNEVKLLVMEMTKYLIDKFFAENGFVTKRNSKLNKKYNCIKTEIHHVGITKTHVFLIAPHIKETNYNNPVTYF